MTQEEKQLLLTDIAARLPYGVFIHYHWSREGSTIDEDRELDFSDVETLKYNIENPQNDWCEISWKPYLRPMSSMTKEEKEELKEEHKKDERIYVEVIERIANGDENARGTAVPHFAVDWCNKYHFDYRGLIEKGLALEAPEGMYKTE